MTDGNGHDSPQTDSPETIAPAVPAEASVESVCHAFEQICNSGQPAPIESLLQLVLPEERARLFRQLLVIEIQARRSRGEVIDWDGYEQRFTNDREIVADVRRADLAAPMGQTIVDVSAPPEDVQTVISAVEHDPGQQETMDDRSIPTDSFRGFRPAPQLPKSRFDVRAEIAHGGLGSVLLAYDPRVRREVAFKVIRGPSVKVSAIVDRFVEEAQITGQLEHPGIVPIYELGWQSDGSPYYAMKLVRGRTFEAAIDACHQLPRGSRERRLGFASLLNQFVDICNTLAFAHSHGVIHRDLKPQNVMLGEFGETLVLDWGLARILETTDSATPDTSASQRTGAVTHGSSSQQPTGDVGRPTLIESRDEMLAGEGVASETTEQSLGGESETGSFARKVVSTSRRSSGTETVHGSVLGTPAYMPPEQALGDSSAVNRLSDVFALGAILYRLLTGKAPYSGRTGRQTLERAIACDYAPPRQIDPSVPRVLEAICLKAMARESTRRYQSAIELKADIEAYLADEPVSAYREPILRRLSRIVRRYRVPFMVTTAVVITAITLPMAITSWQRNQVDQRAVALLAQASEAEDTGNLTEARKMLAQASELLARQPGLQKRRFSVEARERQIESRIATLELQAESARREAIEKALKQAEENFQRAEQEQLRANRNLRIATARRLVAESRRVADEKPRLSALLAVEALQPSLNAGDPIVPEALQNLFDVMRQSGGLGLSGHTAQIRDTAISPDGKWLLTGSGDRTARLWKLAAIQPAPIVSDPVNQRAEEPVVSRVSFIELRGHEGSVDCVALTSDGRLAVTAGADGDVVLWNLSANDIAASYTVLKGHSLPVTSLVVSAEGNWLATAGLDPFVLLWNLRAEKPGQKPVRLAAGDSAWNSLTFTPDGTRLIAGNDAGTIAVWNVGDTASPATITEPAKHAAGVVALDVSPDGRWLVSGASDGEVLAWPLEELSADLKPIKLTAHESTLRCLKFAPFRDRAVVATSSGDGLLRIETMEGRVSKVIGEFEEHSAAINDIRWLRAGRWIATASDDRTVRMMDWESSSDDRSLDLVLAAHEDVVWSLSASDDGHWLAAGALDGFVQLWDLHDAAVASRESVLDVHTRTIRTIATGGNRWLGTVSADQSASALLWDLQAEGGSSAARPVAVSLPESSGRITALSWHPDGSELATGNQEGTVALWAPGATLELRSSFNLGSRVVQVCYSRNGQWFAAAAEKGTLRIQPTDGKGDNTPGAVSETKMDSTALRDSIVSASDLHPELPLLAVGTVDGSVLVWSPGTEPRRLQGVHSATVNAVRFSPDGHWLASVANDRSVRVWRRPASKDEDVTPLVLLKHSDRVRDLAFTPDSRRLISVGDDGTGMIWPLQAKSVENDAVPLSGHARAINSVSISGDGLWALTGSDDGTVRLWPLDAVNPSAAAIVLPMTEDRVTSVVADVDGRRQFAAGTHRGALHLLPRDRALMIALARRSAGRGLTPAERLEYDLPEVTLPAASNSLK